ncbi:podoplanin isoform X1 [Anolis carolinensis]|uniref:podoplanin isoform X1 n=1 Tax=Anolis carolinensis TaxID=28377 RepID=UPI002F2B4F00
MFFGPHHRAHPWKQNPLSPLSLRDLTCFGDRRARCGARLSSWPSSLGPRGFVLRPRKELTPDTPPSTQDATEPDLPDTSDDGLETATLVGIIVGIIAAIGVATAVIVAVVKRTSGRYS